MISQYSRPEDIDREFWQDFPHVTYWLKKHTNRNQMKWDMLEKGWDVMNCRKDYSFSDPIFYTSPKTGNRWVAYLTTKRDDAGKLHMYQRTILYYYTEVYMTIMIPMMTVEENEDGDRRMEMRGINIYTAHMFQRMADPDRLGVDMSDRMKVMRNFTEFVAEGWSDTRPPREGEQHTQLMLRTPASWLRGHMVFIEDRYVAIYRTFFTDRSMTYKQRKDVRSFKRFADANTKK